MDHLAQDIVGGHDLTRRLTCHDTAPLLADPPRSQSEECRCDRGMWRERGEASSLLGRGWRSVSIAMHRDWSPAGWAVRCAFLPADWQTGPEATVPDQPSGTPGR